MNLDNPDGATSLKNKTEQQLTITVTALRDTYNKMNTQERLLKDAEQHIKHLYTQIQLQNEQLKKSSQNEQSLKSAYNKINTLERQLKEANDKINQQVIVIEIQTEKLNQLVRLEQLLREANKKIRSQEDRLKEMTDKISLKTIENETLKVEIDAFKRREDERLKEIKRNKKLHRLRAFSESLLYSLSAVLVGFGINLQTSNPPNTLGDRLVAIAIAIQIIVSFSAIFIQGERN